jgi:uncharacterized protein YndB with AHSA1/START domain
MSTPSDPIVRVTRHLPFPADRVFDAWLDPAIASKWLFATPTGKMVRAEVDPKVGGRFTFTERRDGEDVEHTGEYLEIDRPRRLVFTFGVPKYSPDFNRVTIEIVPQGESCELTLTQEMLPQWAHFQKRTQFGWGQILHGLAASLGDRRAVVNRELGQFTAPGEVRLVRLLPGPIERVWEYLTDSEKRATWFAGGPIELRTGGKVELFFRHSNISPDEEPPERYREVHYTGFTMVGQVTECEPPRRIEFTWEGEKPEVQSRVRFELTPKGDDVELVLTHRRLASDAERVDVSGGWHLHTAILAAHLAGDTPPPLWAAHQMVEALYKKRLPAS